MTALGVGGGGLEGFIRTESSKPGLMETRHLRWVLAYGSHLIFFFTFVAPVLLFAQIEKEVHTHTHTQTHAQISFQTFPARGRIHRRRNLPAFKNPLDRPQPLSGCDVTAGKAVKPLRACT